MVIPFKKLRPDAKAPTRAHHWDAGWDLYVAAVEYLYADSSRSLYADTSRQIVCLTGIGVSIPPGYMGLLFMRSSVRDTCQILANAVGVIDQYQGELVFTYRVFTGDPRPYYQIGDKCGQIVFIERPTTIMEEVEEFHTVSARGTSGLGSSGK